MDFSTLLQRRIYQLCDEQNITINRLATLSELNASGIDKIVKGKTENPSFVTLFSLARGFNMTIADFLNFDELNAGQLKDVRKYKKEQLQKHTQE